VLSLKLKKEIVFKPIGYIRSKYTENVPVVQPVDEDGHYLEINQELQPALAYLTEFKYIYVLFYIDRLNIESAFKLRINKYDELEVGLFATRTPARPNPIGLSIVKLLSINENRLYISGIDALDGTPILDIKPYIKQLDNRADANDGWIKKELQENDKVILYTDGACSGNPGPGGYAAIIVNDGKELEVSGYEANTTNNRMELRAVIEGLKKIKLHSNVRLVSDSTYVLHGLNSWLEGWKKKGWRTSGNQPVKNKDLWQELDSLKANYQLELVKIKGHSGHHYNEKVDTLARKQIEDHV
jgi:ribonuclease HI